MVSLRKSELFKRFEEAMRRSGLTFLWISNGKDHPATYQAINSEKSFRLRLYIWNLSFGGRVSLPDELRIQVTGLPEIDGRQHFVRDGSGKTAILGWSEDFGEFAAFDIGRHLGPLGGSPSIQIRRPALEDAKINGLALHVRGVDELAFAVRPDYLGAYLENMVELHSCASSGHAVKLLAEICENPQSVDDKEIASAVPEPRRYAIVSARKALRDANFKDRVLTAYSNTCAMCGIQLRLLDAAHILPAAHPDSTDETSNGISLCALHHRAYDGGFVTFDSKYRVHANELLERKLRDLRLDRGLENFKASLFSVLSVPPDRNDRPSALRVEKANALRGWKL